MPKQPTTSWTMESELCKVAEVRDVSTALSKLKLISRSDAKYKLVAGRDGWVRGGAETYIFRFDVVEEGIPSKCALFKACVAFGVTGSVDDILNSWIQRRELLSSNGVSTPTLYGWGQGIVIEEYIPFDLSMLLKQSQSVEESLILDLAKYAAKLSKLGFAPIGPFDDLRSRATDIVVVDFGSDLGPAGVFEGPRPDLFDMLETFLRSHAVSVSENLRHTLRATFASNGGEFLH